jgi:hypothetical protein
MPLLLAQETLDRALQRTLYWHQTDLQQAAIAQIQRDAASMFAGQSYDILNAVMLADIREAKKEEDDDRKKAILLLLLAAIAAALAGRLDHDVALLRPGLTTALETAVSNGGLVRYGITPDMRAIDAERYLREHGADLVKGINQFTQEQMRVILADGLRRGQSIEDVASRLMGTMDEMRWYRARRIAITESSKAWSYAELQSAGEMAKAGYRMVKEWLLGPMHPKYDPCDHNHEQGAIPVDKTFSTGDMAPPQHPNCGCSLITYPAPGDQPWGTPVLGGLPVMPFGFEQGDQRG